MDLIQSAHGGPPSPSPSDERHAKGSRTPGTIAVKLLYSSRSEFALGFVPDTIVPRPGAIADSFLNPGLRDLGGPLHVCILSHTPFVEDEVMVAKPIGCVRYALSESVETIIIAVHSEDPFFGNLDSISDCSVKLLARLENFIAGEKLGCSRGQLKRVELFEIFEKSRAARILASALKK